MASSRDLVIGLTDCAVGPVGGSHDDLGGVGPTSVSTVLEGTQESIRSITVVSGLLPLPSSVAAVMSSAFSSKSRPFPVSCLPRGLSSVLGGEATETD